MLTLREAAEQLGMTPDTLRQSIRRGVLTARKIGPLWVVDQAEVDRYRAEHRRPHAVRFCDRDAYCRRQPGHFGPCTGEQA